MSPMDITLTQLSSSQESISNRYEDDNTPSQQFYLPFDVDLDQPHLVQTHSYTVAQQSSESQVPLTQSQLSSQEFSESDPNSRHTTTINASQPTQIFEAPVRDIPPHNTFEALPGTSGNISPPLNHQSDDSIENWHGSPFPYSQDLPSNLPTDPQNSRTHTASELSIFAFQNLNGLQTYGTSLSDSVRDLKEMQRDMHISVLSVSEHHVPAQQPQIITQLKTLCQHSTPANGKFHIHLNSSSAQPSKTNRLIGGTGILNQGSIVGRINHQYTTGDIMGRWSICQYNRKNKPPLVLVSIYQVCQQPTNKTGQTAWHQQRLFLDSQHRHQEHPREAFRKDLEQLLEYHYSQQHAIIIGGDWNESFESPNSLLLKLCTKFNLVDPWLANHPSYDNFATHARGSTRIDTVLISHSLLPSLHRVSYTPVGWLTNSDHRAIILSFNTKLLFNQNIQSNETFLQRAVRSKDSIAVMTFVEATHSYLMENHTTFSRGLISSMNHVRDNQTDLDVEELDQLLGKAMDFGESQCKRRRSTWYSLPLVKKRLEISILKHYKQGLLQQKDRTISTNQKLSRITSDIVAPLTKSEVDSHLNRLIQQRNEMKAKSLELRHLQMEADSPTSSKPKDPRAKIKKAEVAARTWKTLNTLKNDTGMAQKIDRIDIPSDWPAPFTTFTTAPTLSDPKNAKIWTTITDPEQMEYYLLLRNRIHFSQAHGTPFTQPPFRDVLDWGATSPASNNILNGTFTTDTPLSETCIRVIRQLARKTEPLVTSDLSEAEFTGKIKAWRETTSTSPSGRHLGRYKAIFIGKSAHSQDLPEYEAFINMQKTIRTVIMSLLNYCIRTGYVLDRWKRITNTMILKDPSNFRIHRLRIIHIYEADLNLLMAVKWRQLLRNADKQLLVNINQYGGRPGCEAQTLAFMEELKIDIAYLSRRTLMTFDNDAASCYDRILPILSSIVNQSYGMPAKITRLHGNMLQQAQYRLTTSNGISEQFYQHTEESPIYGTGQGSGNSPVVWLLISATLFDVHNQLSNGATFQSPDGTIQTTSSISGFVDDTNTSLTSWHPQHQDSTSTMLCTLKREAQYWNDLLFISGGKLELTKCSFHVLEFLFRPDGTPAPNLKEPSPIDLTDSITGMDIPIHPLGVNAPHKTLGHWKAPAGKSTTQLKFLQKRASTMSHLIATSPLSRYGAKLAYRAMYEATLKYSLPQCHFKHTTLRKAEKQSINLLISKCGFSSKSPHPVLFTPIKMAGAGFTHWETLQSIGQITMFLKHWRSPQTQSSSLLRIATAWLQWQSGSQTSLLVDTATNRDYIEARWMLSLREGLAASNATFRVNLPMIPMPERKNDKYIMDYAISTVAFSQKETWILNCCRLYLHVTTISEMFTTDGSQLLPHIRTGHRAPWFDPKITIALQSRPNDYQWRKVWKKLCTMITNTQWNFGTFEQSPYPRPRLRREMYHDTGTIYFWYGGQYRRCAPTDSPLIFLIQSQEENEWEPTSKSTPIDKIARVRDKVYLHASFLDTIATGLQNQESTASTASAPQTTNTFTLTPQYTTLLHYVEWKTPVAESYHLLTTLPDSVSIMIVSDGSSLHGTRMSYGTIIGLPTGRSLCEISGPGYGQTSSHRAECYGCLAGVMLLKALAEHHHRHQLRQYRKIQLYSDNQTMISNLQKRSEYDQCYVNATLSADWDLLEEISAMLQQISRQPPVFTWVKGHQATDKDDLSDLPPEVQFNIRADTLAENYYTQQPQHTRTPAPLLTCTQCHLDVNNHTVTSNYTELLKQSISRRPYLNYLKTRHEWSDQEINDVDWYALESATNTYFATEVHLTKLVHNLLPTRAHTARYRPWQLATCHYCPSPETFLHLQQCHHHPSSQEYRTRLFDQLQEYMTTKNLPTAFQQQFCQAVRINLDVEPDIATYPIDSPLHSQQCIGFHLVTRGFLSSRWFNLLEQEHENQVQRHRTALLNPNPYVRDTPENSPPKFSKSHNHIAQLIKIMWTNMGQLWMDHLKLIHLPTTPNGHESTEEVTTLRQHVQLLHSFRDILGPTSNLTYFNEDLSTFLYRSSSDVHRRYILNYKPLIISEVRAYLSASGMSRSEITKRIRETLTWDSTSMSLLLPPADTYNPELTHRTDVNLNLPESTSVATTDTESQAST